MQGRCAKCKSDNILYSDSEKRDDNIGYFYTCEECDHEGIEWYIEVYEESE